MSTNNPARRDARHCPRCGAMGILPLDQPAGEHGEIDSPMMICPVCEEEFTATGMRWLGVFKVSEVRDEQLDEMSEQITDSWFPEGNGEQLHAVSNDLIDPFGGPDEPDPDLTLPREEDGAGSLD